MTLDLAIIIACLLLLVVALAVALSYPGSADTPAEADLRWRQLAVAMLSQHYIHPDLLSSEPPHPSDHQPSLDQSDTTSGTP